MNIFHCLLETLGVCNVTVFSLICATLILIVAILQFIFSRNSALRSSSVLHDSHQRHKTEGPSSGSKDKRSDGVPRGRHTRRSLDESSIRHIDHTPQVTISSLDEKGAEVQQHKHQLQRGRSSSISKKKITHVCTDPKSHVLSRRDSHPLDSTTHSHADIRRLSPPLVSEAQVPEQSATSEEWRPVVRKLKKGRRQPKQFEGEKTPEDPITNPSIEACVEERLFTLSGDDSSSLGPSNATQQPQESAAPMLSCGSLQTTDTAPPCPVELSANPTAQQSAVPDVKKSRRKRRNRPVQTYATKDGDAKMGGNHMSLPDSVDNKPLLDDSEFEVVEAPFLSSCSPGASSESDHGITDINPATTVSASAEIPSISSIEEFPCLPGAESQFACAPSLAALEVREGDRHPQAVRLLTSALGENGDSTNTQRTAKSRARKAD
ncbi:unnamed protein product [Dicrocoelium dendriticum]|nr:unnamed protein product [Dicrocoelium dendriticum]